MALPIIAELFPNSCWMPLTRLKCVEWFKIIYFANVRFWQLSNERSLSKSSKHRVGFSSAELFQFQIPWAINNPIELARKLAFKFCDTLCSLLIIDKFCAAFWMANCIAIFCLKVRLNTQRTGYCGGIDLCKANIDELGYFFLIHVFYD